MSDNCPCPLCDTDKLKRANVIAQECIDRRASDLDTQVPAYGFLMAGAALSKGANIDLLEFLLICKKVFESTEHHMEGELH